MRKFIFLLVFGLMVAGAHSLAVADDDFAGKEPVNPDAQGRGLVDTDAAALNAKVNELERKINDIEREQRFSQDRVRQLDRDVSEIKRHF